MKKLETLLQLDTGNYDTPKKLNRSEKAIPRSFIESIEASEITSESLATIARSGFPVFRYKTCITIHGAFDLEKLPRIGGYKNLIQNGNGSLEIRYNAIDFGRKARIIRTLKDVSKFSGYTDSRGTVLQRWLEISDKGSFEAEYTELQAALNRVQCVDFYGKAYMFKASMPWGGTVLCVEIVLDAIREGQVQALILAASGLDANELDTQLKAAQAARDEREAEYERDKAARENHKAEIEAKRLELEAALAGKPAMQYTVGAHGVKAVVIHGTPTYKFVRIMKKGSFGRFGYEWAFGPNPDVVDFRPAVKQAKPDEIGHYFAV